MERRIRNKIIKEIKQLKAFDDCCSIKISKDKGIFILVDYNWLEEKEVYFIELNDIFRDEWIPCGYYCETADFNNVEQLIDKIEKYTKYHGIVI